jgi:hypothetical protein
LCAALGILESSLAVYEVKWKELAKYMTRQLSITLAVGFVVLMLIRYVSTGFSIETTFEHIHLNHIPFVFLGIFLFSLTFAFLISALLRCARVTISNETISGRNYWLFKKEFKLEDIEKSFLFSSNGMPVVVVDAGKNGDIYIPIHIENSEDLFSILDKYQKSA